MRAYRATGGETGWTTELGLLAGDRISEATLRDEIAKKPQASLLVYKSQEEVLGCVWVEPDPDGDTWYLGSLAIDPKQQNNQLGRRLLGAIVQCLCSCLDRKVSVCHRFLEFLFERQSQDDELLSEQLEAIELVELASEL